MRPVVSMSSRPTGYRRPADGTSDTTVVRRCGSRAVETTPAGLLTAYTARWASGATAAPSTVTSSPSPTSRAGSVAVSPLTVTRSARTISSAARREATPAVARNFARRIEGHATIDSVDLELLTSTLGHLGRPPHP